MRHDDPATEDLLFPEIHRALMAAAGRHVAPSAPSAPTRRAKRRTATLAALVAFAAGGTALAASGWSPTLGDDDRGHPTVSAGTIPGDQTAALGVLRRPQTDADRGPKVQALLKVLSADITGGVHLDSVRLLDTRPDGVTVLFAAERDGSNALGGAQDKQRDVVCLLYGIDHPVNARTGERLMTAGPSGTTACVTERQLAAGKAVLDGPQYGGRYVITGLVPDGVTNVSVNVRHRGTRTAKVVDNTFTATEPADPAQPQANIYDLSSIKWLDAAGRALPRDR